MNGADILVRTALAAGVNVCFANPGTTEIPIVRALDSAPGVRVVLGLFEGVCTGAADGYGRMLERPAMVLLHLGPGLANGLANLHNARRANSPLLNVIGEHATWHRQADPPLAMDIEGLARTVSGWYRTCKSPSEIAKDVAEAIAASRFGQTSTLIVPNDHQLAPCEDCSVEQPVWGFEPIDPRSIGEIASRLRQFRKLAVVLGGRTLRKPGLNAVSKVQMAIGCDLFSRSLPGYVDRGVGLPDVKRLPHFPAQAAAALSSYDAVLLVGTPEPVTFFGYPGVRSRVLTDEQEKIYLCAARQNVVEALEALAEALGPSNERADTRVASAVQRPAVATGDLTAEKVCATMAALQPENAIIVDESITTGEFYYPHSGSLPPHTVLTDTGGSIGQGIPCAIGAAIACPDRPVINLEGDGSAMYTVQALWTQARESLNVTTLICSNRSYRVLQMELAREGMGAGPNVRKYTELAGPAIDWVNLASGLGVPAVTVRTAEELARELKKSFDEPGPHLVEALLP